MTSGQNIRDIVIITVLGLTVQFVSSSDKSAGWCYAIALMIAYIIAQPGKAKTFTNFFAQIASYKG